MRFFKYNANPKQKNVGDCVIRALAVAVDKEWVTVMEETYPIAIELACPNNWKDTIHEYLKRNGFERISAQPKKGGSRITVKEFAMKHPEGRFYLEIAHHAVAVVDGYYYDTWDCGNKCLYGYFEKRSK